MSVSNKLLQLADAALADAHPPEPLELERLGTTPTVRMPISRAVRAMTGASPVPRAAAHDPAVMNTMCGAHQLVADLVDDLSAAARPTSGCAPAPRPRDLQAHLDDPLGLGVAERLSVGVSPRRTRRPEAAFDHVV